MPGRDLCAFNLPQGPEHATARESNLREGHSIILLRVVALLRIPIVATISLR